ncbi:MAG: hypothetical protein U9Q12_00380 [Patescibacteria group bacterium]|nr:hypothetical protein [Patescibacteria group bacterium]
MKKIILIVVTIIAFCTTAVIVALTCQKGVDYVTELIVMEQVNHHGKMQSEIKRLQSAVDNIDEYVQIMQKRILSADEKEIVTKKLRHIEEVSLNISRQTGFYQEDTTVHFFFVPNDEIVSYFNQTRNTPLFVERFVRATEQGLFDGYLTKNKKNMVMENYELLQSELEDL